MQEEKVNIYSKRDFPPHGIMFHHFHDNVIHNKSQGSISSSQLKQLLKIIGVEKIITPNAWIKKVQDQTLKHGELCLTFDDNLKSQYDIAFPVLEELGLKAFFFVYTSVYENNEDKLEIYRYFRENHFDNIKDFYSKFFEKLFSESEFSHIPNDIKTIDFNAYKKDYYFYTSNDRKYRYIRDEILSSASYYRFMDNWIDEEKVYNLHFFQVHKLQN